MNQLIKNIAESWKLEAASEDVKYFYNYGEVDSILSGRKCYVIGRKGMGKSAICRHIENVHAHNMFALKLTFKNFPFNELYSLEDGRFTQPNQYITLWKYLICVKVCELMLKNESIDEEVRKKLRNVFPENTIDALDRRVKRWTSIDFSLSVLSVGLGASMQRTSEKETVSWIDKVDILEDFIVKNAGGDAKYYIVFDELDEDYRSIREESHSNLYIPLLTGLFKAVQSVKTTFRSKGVQVHPVVFLRDDIYSQIRDADKNKWADLKIELEWNEDRIKNLLAYRMSQDWDNGKEILAFDMIWNKIIKKGTVVHLGDRQKKTTDSFSYMVRSTQLRPRDFIEYVRCCCQEAIDRHKDRIDERIILHVDRAFSNYLKDEFVDEIHPVLPDIVNIFQVFSTIGKWNLKVIEFREKFQEFVDSGIIKEKNIDYVLETLFDFSVIGNQHKSQKGIFFFKFKQTNMKYNKDENIIRHYID